MKTIGKPWFAARRFGYGAGVPIAWQGWAVLAAFVLGLAAATTWLSGGLRVGAITALVMVLAAISAPKTEGGWRWRWFDDPR